MANKVNYTEMSLEQLNTELANVQKEVADFRFNQQVAPAGDTTLIKKARKDATRILTELRARELKELEAAGKLPARDRIVARRRRGL